MSVGISGDTAVVGAWLANGAANNSGMAFLFDAEVPEPSTLGDLNGDGLVNAQDINPFVLAMIDLPAWAEILRERRLPVSRMEWKASEFAEVAPTKLFPTGASFTVMVDDFEQAKAMIQKGVT